MSSYKKQEELDTCSYFEGGEKVLKQDDIKNNYKDGIEERTENSINTFIFKNIAKSKMLSNEEMMVIFKNLREKRKNLKEAVNQKVEKREIDLIKEKILEMENKIINGNLKLAAFIARQYIGITKLEYADLVQESVVGLGKAVKKFDCEMEVKFSTYAVWWIRQNIQRALDDTGRTIRIPVYFAETIRRFYAIKNNFLKINGRYPNKEELQKLCGLTHKKIKLIEVSYPLGKLKSLDTFFKEDDEDDLSFYNSAKLEIKASPEELIDETAFNERFIEIIKNSLSLQEFEVIKNRFGIDLENTMTLAEIGKNFGLSRERVRQIEENAFFKLRTPKVLRELQENADISDDQIKKAEELYKQRKKKMEEKNEKQKNLYNPKYEKRRAGFIYKVKK